MDESEVLNLSDVYTLASATSGLATIEAQNNIISPDTIEEVCVNRTESFPCLAQMILSRSSVLGHKLYEFPPIPDPGVVDSFDFKRDQVEYDSAQSNVIYISKCKEFQIPIIQRVLKSLETSRLDLRYFGLTPKQVVAITTALTLNRHVKELILEENYLTDKCVFYISEMLRDNNCTEYLNLSQCNMDVKCCAELVEGISTTQSIKELDLSKNNIGNEGLRKLLPCLRDNSSIVKLDLSHNSLSEEVAEEFGNALAENESIEELNLSWNNLSTRKSMYLICKGISDGDRLKVLNLSWNGIKDDDSFYPVQRYIFKTKTLKHLDISNNNMQGPVLQMIKRSILGNSSLISINLSSNLISPDEAYDLAQVFVAKTRKPIKLQFLDMDNIVVNKNFVPYWQMITARGKRIRVEYVLGNYEIAGPNVTKILFDRLRFITNKRKSLKGKREFGHLIYNLGQNFVSRSDFLLAIKSSKFSKLIKQNDLLKEIIKIYINKYDKMDIRKMKEDYYRLYPNTTIPIKKDKAKKKIGKSTNADNLIDNITDNIADNIAQTDTAISKTNLRWKEKSEVLLYTEGVSEIDLEKQLPQPKPSILKHPSINEFKR